MSESKLWQLRAGLITESEYQESMEEGMVNTSGLKNQLKQLMMDISLMKGLQPNEVDELSKLITNITGAMQDPKNIATVIKAVNDTFSNRIKGLNISKNTTPSFATGGKFNMSKNKDANFAKPGTTSNPAV